MATYVLWFYVDTQSGLYKRFVQTVHHLHVNCVLPNIPNAMSNKFVATTVTVTAVALFITCGYIEAGKLKFKLVYLSFITFELGIKKTKINRAIMLSS